MEQNNEETFRRFQKEKRNLSRSMAKREIDNVMEMEGIEWADVIWAYPAECVIFEMRISDKETEYYMPGYVDFRSHDLEEVERKLFAFFIEEGLEFDS